MKKQLRNNQKLKILLFILPVIIFLVFLFIKIISPEYYSKLIKEDSAIEDVQFVCYFISSIFALLLARKFAKAKFIMHTILYSILGVGLISISLEEISWGQRIFNIETPGYFEQNNIQNEISIHNLGGIQNVTTKAYLITGFYGTFAWIFLKLFTHRSKQRYCHITNFLAPDWFLSSYFFFTLFVYLLLNYNGLLVDRFGFEEFRFNTFMKWRDQEPVELILALGFMLFTIFNNVKLDYALRPQTDKM